MKLMATQKAAKKTAAAPAPAKKPVVKLTVADLIKANNKALGAAVAAGDAKAVALMYTKTAKLLPPNAPLSKGAKAITAFWQGAVEMGIKGATLKSQEVEQLGTTAIEVGAYTLSGEGGVTLDTGKYLVVWKKEGREWKLHRDIFNSNGAPAA
jgi:ketosteroid isomerase-like protein